MDIKHFASLTLFEIRALRIMFGPKRMKGGYRKLHNEKLHNLYLSPDIKIIKSVSYKGASTLLVLVLVLAWLVLVWLLFVLVNLRPHYFSCSPGFGV
jgi:hypothetical protein